ncbi:MFS transporter [Gluconacetobacter azotocaptans]|uniref:MFS transporter n=1 Tax=Gluconacetobacter azotocaptans TaxID=142834 RepID=A0A7W4JUW1_9PROT|nr:MFS transporter [Gluconacetobacter azotocaptans]MBB2191288.1 MFS transporter [Gluconacetobacter azotocaptans]MBM9403722.1 MFS transporter [Gluconacetobacter azotocaptans]GBQ36006.1 major facilitator superfamily transporter [Gluconacetobacter azotocaptans DSM 13594]
MEPVPAARPRGQYRALLRERDFCLFFVATTSSTLGSAIIPVAMTFALLARGRSATTIGLVLAAQTAPTIVLMLAGGVVGDRWPRRRLMIGADLLRCVSQSLLAGVLTLRHPPLPALLALVACLGIGNAFYGPAETGLIPEIAGRHRIRQANGLLSISSSLTAIVGPSLGGLLVSLGNAPLAIGLDATSYAISACCLALIRTAMRDRPPPASFLHDFRLGWREFRTHGWLRLVTAQYGLLDLVAFAPFFVLGPVLLASRPDGARLWGLVSSATGMGGVLGGLLVLRIHPARPLVAFELAAALLTLPLVMLALHVPVLVLALGSAVFGAALAVLNVTVQTAVQEQIPHTVLSRVNALFSLVAVGMGPVGFALCGPMAHMVGTRRWLGIGAGIILLSVAALLMSRRIWGLQAAPPPDATG